MSWARRCRHSSLLVALPLFVLANTTPGTAAPLDARDSLPGRWEGAILVRPAELEVGMALELTREANDLQGSISFPTQSLAVHPLAQVDAQGAVVQWIYKDPSGDPSSFDGTLSPDGREIAGTVLDGGKTIRFTLRKVERAAPPPPVARLSPDGAELRARFDRDADDVRLLMILSPSCTYCKSNTRIVQTYVLDHISDPHIKVYVVWEHVNPGDSEAASRGVASLMSDGRATHFWSDHRFTGNAFREAVGAKTLPPWDLVLAFAPGERWRERSPSPGFYMYNSAGGDAGASRPFNGVKLAEKVAELLRARPAR